MLPLISVVIPAWNEGRQISVTIHVVAGFFKAQNWPYEIIVVDDGSTDTTADQAEVAGVKVISHTTNRGKGAAVCSGVAAASGELVLIYDADCSTPISEVVKLLPWVEHYPIVIGSRAITGSNVTVSQVWWKQSLGRLGNKLIKIVLGLPFADTQCGFKLFAKSALPLFSKLTLDRWGFDFELLTAARQNHIAVREVGVTWHNDATSSVTSGDYLRTLREVFTVRWLAARGRYLVNSK